MYISSLRTCKSNTLANGLSINLLLNKLVLEQTFKLKVIDFNKRNLFLTAKLLKQGYRYHKIRKAFSKIVSEYDQEIP